MLIIIIWTILTFISVVGNIFEGTSIRLIFTIPMVLFIPGYVLIMALFPKKDELGMTERICMSFGLSIVVLSLLGLILNLTFGIRLIPILITICIYTIIMTLIVNIRQRKLKDEALDDIVIVNNVKRTRKDIFLSIVVILVGILTITTIYYAITTPKIGERITEFYVLNSDRSAGNFSSNLKLGSNITNTLLIGVTNNEYSNNSYIMNIVLDKNVIATEKLALNNGENWEKKVTFVPNKVGYNMKLELLLYKENDTTVPYRKLRLWADAT